MASIAKHTRRVMKRATVAWRTAAIEHTPPWAKRALGPLAKHLDMLFIDHGFVRVIYLNRHRLGDRAWRSAQPTPQHIGRLARDGIRTIVNLRGVRLCGSYWLEEAACRRHGITLVNFQIRSRAAPSREEVRRARELFERIEYPMLMHCKSGADRAGLMSALYQVFEGGRPVSEAKDQLALRFGHIRQADTGVLDYFFERYLADSERRPMPFLEWVETVYDADELKLSFVAKGWANRLVDGVLRRE